MQSGWYLLYVAPESEGSDCTHVPVFPLLGDRVVHHLGAGQTEAEAATDKKNPLFDKIQDGSRPAWAPDLLRLGYAYVFQRKGLPKLALQLGIKNPQKLLEQEGGVLKQKGGHRVLTFNDVFVVGVQPGRRPFYAPNLGMGTEEWWTATNARPPVWAPFLAPQGAQVVEPACRLADVVMRMLGTPEGFPRPTPENPISDSPYSEFTSPGVPLLPRVVPDVSYVYGPGALGRDNGYASGLELFRY
jgi:hypothetical protein